MLGRAGSSWRLADETLHLEAIVPPGATGTVCLPTSDADSVTESGRPARDAEGVQPLSPAGGRARFEIGAGTYRFAAPYAPPAPPAEED
jgi:alpha-L-rhamnosidase